MYVTFILSHVDGSIKPCIVRNMNTEQQIAKDLDLIDGIEVLGTKANVRKARKHRKACFAAIAAMNKADGLDTMSDEDLLNELTK